MRSTSIINKSLLAVFISLIIIIPSTSYGLTTSESDSLKLKSSSVQLNPIAKRLEDLKKENAKLKLQIQALLDQLAGSKSKKTSCKDELSSSTRRNELIRTIDQTPIKLELNSTCDPYNKEIKYMIKKDKKIISRDVLGFEDVYEDDGNWTGVATLLTNLQQNGIYTYTFEYGKASTSIDIKVSRPKKN